MPFSCQKKMKMTDYFADRAAEWDKPKKIEMADNFVDNAPVEISHGEISKYRSADIDFVFSNMAFHHIEDIPKTLEHLSVKQVFGCCTSKPTTCCDRKKFPANYSIMNSLF